MYKVTIGKDSFRLPSAWNEVTLTQYLKLSKGDLKMLEVLSILSGLSVQKLRKIKAARLGDYLSEKLAYLLSPPDFSDISINSEIKLNTGQIIAIPEDVDKWEFGQRSDVNDEFQAMELEETPINFYTAAPLLLSVALCSQILNEEYKDTEQADRVKGIIGELPCTVALPLSAFFLSNWDRVPNTGIIFCQEEGKETLWKRLLRSLRQRCKAISRFIRLSK